MIGVVCTLLVALGAAGLGLLLVGRWLKDEDPALRIGVSGLIGLGSMGLITLPIGLLPGGLRWGIAVILALTVAGYAYAFRQSKTQPTKFQLPKGPELLFPVVIAIAMLFALVGVLAPSDSLDWDSLAYHLAVPKMWLQAGQIHFVSFIHHSNFPFSIDNLYIWGLAWGGEHGAKAFSWCLTGYGLIAIFGFARERFGGLAGWWSSLAFATIPAVIWLSGTGYIDVSNGLFAGLGILFAARLIAEPTETRFAWLSAVLLGFAAGSKYTGLQTIFAVSVVILVFGLIRPTVKASPIASAFLVGAVALAIASPWYIKNVINTGNPVYPFFYGVFGGKNWDAFSGAIYSEEQKTFGVGLQGGLHPMQIGHAIFGLAYQPGRYINPGQTTGQGFPIGALGVVALVSGLLWALSGKLRRFEGAVLAIIGLSFLMWFALSQQSRYIIALSVPLTVLAGGAAVKLSTRRLMAGIIGLQAIYSLYLLNTVRVSDQLSVVSGKVSSSEYLASRVGFFEAAAVIDKAAAKGRVALFDEVFGFFLNVPYFWANPGHTTELGYAEMTSGDDLVASLKRLGITHVYLNLGIYPPKDPTFQRWAAAMGLGDQAPVPYEGDERAGMTADLRNKWKVLIAEAIASGKLAPVQRFKRSILYQVE